MRFISSMRLIIAAVSSLPGHCADVRWYRRCDMATSIAFSAGLRPFQCCGEAVGLLSPTTMVVPNGGERLCGGRLVLGAYAVAGYHWDDDKAPGATSRGPYVKPSASLRSAEGYKSRKENFFLRKTASRRKVSSPVGAATLVIFVPSSLFVFLESRFTTGGVAALVEGECGR